MYQSLDLGGLHHAMFGVGSDTLNGGGSEPLDKILAQF